ncbi:50S ribosomal protein L13 [Candidatus Roizmanbacteria bacterium RIFCSPLOWO2_01_FULL_42_14]|uniref:Large ribosomal subunit protein uL13 n=2 Tax=Candidatus Roizmaniibacteriota TaxID=1752723 RepID=A0A1F7J9C5_9BACT|nr:MAG: 50S ribosomal protein L13 [Candidatus Roizmanbacteria bacterium RIFCSPHIGHO2_12_FULL_42_10]OGK52213.1 MAG: 50S ribosomal protein L13 [Candidatus Roizmanbacteria bacterium RIFCSPLOWO2_01_FULL_42_14]
MTHLTHTTHATKNEDVVRMWHLIDVKGQVLGRMATDIAGKLMGKGKPSFSSHVDGGDHVIVINAQHIKITGRKEQQKIYTRYSGYPGGLRKQSFALLKSKDVRKIIGNAVSGMLPKNKHRDVRMTRLYIYTGETHPHQNKLAH